MELQVVSLLQSKLLKQLHFDWITNDFYLGGLLLCDPVGFLSEKTDNLFLAPSIQLALKWCREIHNIYAKIITLSDPFYFYYEVYNMENMSIIGFHPPEENKIYNYDEASNESLDYIIQYLLIKQQNET